MPVHGPLRHPARARIPAIALVCMTVAGSAEAARRSEKQLEMDRQREEMRRQAEQKRLDPNTTLKPPVLPGSSGVFTPLVLPPPSLGRSAPPAAPAGDKPADDPARAAGPSSPAPPPVSPAAGESVDPDPLLQQASFRRGAELFNSALALFRQFEADRNSTRLSSIPGMCDQAVEAFEACRPSFPGDARLDKYIEQCHGLTRYARQSLLMSPAPSRR